MAKIEPRKDWTLEKEGRMVLALACEVLRRHETKLKNLDEDIFKDVSNASMDKKLLAWYEAKRHFTVIAWRSLFEECCSKFSSMATFRDLSTIFLRLEAKGYFNKYLVPGFKQKYIFYPSTELWTLSYREDSIITANAEELLSFHPASVKPLTAKRKFLDYLWESNFKDPLDLAAQFAFFRTGEALSEFCGSPRDKAFEAEERFKSSEKRKDEAFFTRREETKAGAWHLDREGRMVLALACEVAAKQDALWREMGLFRELGDPTVETIDFPKGVTSRNPRWRFWGRISNHFTLSAWSRNFASCTSRFSQMAYMPVHKIRNLMELLRELGYFTRHYGSVGGDLTEPIYFFAFHEENPVIQAEVEYLQSIGVNGRNSEILDALWEANFKLPLLSVSSFSFKQFPQKYEQEYEQKKPSCVCSFNDVTSPSVAPDADEFLLLPGVMVKINEEVLKETSPTPVSSFVEELREFLHSMKQFSPPHERTAQEEGELHGEKVYSYALDFSTTNTQMQQYAAFARTYLWKFLGKLNAFWSRETFNQHYEQIGIMGENKALYRKKENK